MWTLLTLAALCASPAQGELLATETRVRIGYSTSEAGAWRFVSIDTKSGNLTPKSIWSVRPPWGGGQIGILEGVVNGELLVQKEALAGYPDSDHDFKGYATWKPGNLNLPGSSLVFPNASGQPQILRTEGVPGAMWAVHETVSTHTGSACGTYTAHTLALSSITDSAKTSLTHLATLGPYGGCITETEGPEQGNSWKSCGIKPQLPSQRTYRLTGDADNAYVMIRYDKQNEDLETYDGYPPLLEFILWQVPTDTNKAPINKTFLNNNITIPCFKEFEFIFKKPNGDGKLLVVARSCCGDCPDGYGDDVHWVMYEIDIEAFDSPTNTDWVVRADTRQGWRKVRQEAPFGFGLSYTYDAAKEVLYTLGWFPYQYLVYATDLSMPNVTSKEFTVINDPRPQSEPDTTYSLSGLAFLPDSEGASSVYV